MFLFYSFLSMKKLSLFSLLGLAGLLAFVATPIYAQEEELAVEDVILEAENVVDDAVDVVDEFIDDTVEVVDDTAETVDDTVEALDDTMNLDEFDFNSIFENDEVKTALDDAGLTEVEAAWIFWGIIWLLLAFGIVGIIVGVVWLILCHIALWRIFWRAWEWKWKSLIPIYNLYIVFKISGIKNRFWYMLLVILIAAIIGAIFPSFEESISNFSGDIVSVIIILVWFLLAKKFGRGNSASILYAIFSGIAVLVLWFWDYKYQWKSDKDSETIVEA